MFTSEAVVTSHGGMTSHAAVVARGWGRPAVVGAGDLLINSVARSATIKGRDDVMIREGDWVSVNGTTGEVSNHSMFVQCKHLRQGMQGLPGVRIILPQVFSGRHDTMVPAASPNLRTIVSWAGSFCPIGVRINADSERDVQAAAAFPGVEGIGLCR